MILSILGETTTSHAHGDVKTKPFYWVDLQLAVKANKHKTINHIQFLHQNQECPRHLQHQQAR
jgi:hypothetical protein